MIAKCFLYALLLSTLLIKSTFADVDVASEPGFVSLFDGESFSGWTGATGSYAIEDGVLACRAGKKGGLYTEQQFSDFELRFEFLLTPGANNGLGIRAPLGGDTAYQGIELQILDDTAEKYRDLQPYQFHGSAYGIAPAKRGALKPVGEWNQQEVHCQGSHIKVILNGTTILDIDLKEAAPDGKTIDGHPHPGLARTTGHLGFLGHYDHVSFRNIRVKSIETTSAQ